MKSRIAVLGIALVSLLASQTVNAQVGEPFIHDPSTIVKCDGKYYTFGTGGGGLVSEDGWNWHSGAVRPGGGAAPDAMKIGDKYLVGYSTTGGGLGGGHAGTVVTMWNNTLDPDSPDFEFTQAVKVAESLVDEDCDAIDVGFLLDPTTGRLWATYGTYFGFIRQVELDPKTGFRVEGNEAIDVAVDCEASVMMYNNGWYYLLGTHGTCCDGVNSTYNIVVGRSRSVNGPFIDNVGRTMIEGGGKMVANAEERRFGAGHFGRYIEEEGVEKASFHWEADLDLSGRSTLAIRPLLWVNDWPVCGDLFEEGVYEIESVRRGYAVELTVDFVRAAGAMMMGGFGGFGRSASPQPNVVIENQKLADVAETWPEGNLETRLSDWMNRPHQRWAFTPVPEAGGYLGGPYFKITIEGTDRALTATAEKEVEAAEYTGDDAQLWRIDQLTDGTYRIMPKAVPGTDEALCLVCVGDCNTSLAKFNFKSDNCKWDLKALKAY